MGRKVVIVKRVITVDVFEAELKDSCKMSLKDIADELCDGGFDLETSGHYVKAIYDGDGKKLTETVNETFDNKINKHSEKYTIRMKKDE